MDLTPFFIGIGVTNLAVLLAGCVLALIRTYRERRHAARPSARQRPPVGTSSRRTRPAGRSST